jgi:hypothetical protein
MIKLLVSVAGQGFSHAPGEEVSLDPEFEKRLIATGQAVEVKKRAAKPSNAAKRATRNAE